MHHFRTGKNSKTYYNNRFNHLSANITKWSITLKQYVLKLSTNCLSVFDHFVGLALKGLRSCKNCVSFSRLEKLGFLVYKLLTNCLSVFDHFVGLALKGLKLKIGKSNSVVVVFSQT